MKNLNLNFLTKTLKSLLVFLSLFALLLIPSISHASTSNFTVSNGKILDPNGHVWIGAGVGLYNWNVLNGVGTLTSGTAVAQQILIEFPKINLIRIASYNFDSPALYAPFVNYMTSRGIVVVLEDHNNQHTVLTGTALQTESNWYASLASYYISNPYVWFQSMNEPDVGDTYQMQATYNAIRATGNNTPIFMEAGSWAGGWTGEIGDTSVFAPMHNIGWDLHCYAQGGDTSSTTLNDIYTDQNNRISYLQSFPSADGIMPVISLEGGNSVQGTNIDPVATLQIQANFTNPNLQAFAAWIWNNNSTSIADNLTSVDGLTLTSYGQQVASYIAKGQGPVNLPPTVSAGTDQTITLPTNSVTLSGTASDPEGKTVTTTWSQVSGPSTATISSPSSLSTSITNLTQGTYSFWLTASDGVNTNADAVVVMVNVAPSTLLPAVFVTNPINGLNYDYYEGTYTTVPDFSTLTPVKSGTTSNFDITLNNIPDYFAFNFKGYINIPSDGQYTFYTSSDDGSKLYIDNNLVVNNDGLHSNTEQSGTIGLKAGYHAISVGYFEYNYNQVLTVSYSSSTITKQSIPNSLLFISSSTPTAESPYLGTPSPIPGTIQAENYDNGGQNVAYYDATAGNSGNYYRTDDVDIESSSEGTPDVGWINNGEWLKYTVNVSTTGNYNIESRVSSIYSGKTMNIEMDGVVVATVTVPNTGTWQTWQSVMSNNIPLTAGQHIMRLYFIDPSSNTTNLFNIDYLTFTKAIAAPTDTTAPTVSLTSPTSGSTISGTVNVSASATDNVAVSKVSFYKDSDTTPFATSATSPYTTSFDTKTLPNGSHSFRAVAYDTSGNTNTATSTNTVSNITPDTTAPTISLTSPTNNSTISGTVNISANASDNVAVTKVEFYRGSTLLGTDTTSPYSLSWDTTLFTNGTYTITAKAYDAAGNSSTTPNTSVTVSNTTTITDTTPPVISSISVSNLTNYTATITWTTNENSSTQVDYGTTTSYGSSSILDVTPTLSHSVDLSNLSRGVTYHYRVRSVDGSGNIANSSDQTFSTPNRLIKTPGITSVGAKKGSVILTWVAPVDPKNHSPYEFYAGALIMRSTTSYIKTPDTQTAIADVKKPITTYHDTNVIDGTTYYYSLFAYDDQGKYSDPAFVSFTPTTTPTIVTPPVTPPPSGGGGGGYTPPVSSSGGGGSYTPPSNTTTYTPPTSNTPVTTGQQQTTSTSSISLNPNGIYKNSSNSDIQNLQQFLNQTLGLSLSVDGVWGLHTINAVRAFQKLNNLTSDGVFGRNTASVANGGTQPTQQTITPPTSNQGCLPGYLFSTITGQSCNTTSTSSISLNPNGIYKNSSNSDIQNLQQFLNQTLGLSLSVDGVWGLHTINAVRAFQKLNNLTSDGVFGRNTASVANGG